MHIITLDTETFYDRDYSLTKMSTEEYIRDPRFETIGVAIKLDDGPIRWYPKPAVRDALQDLPWNDALLVGQNTMFDAAILAWHYDIHPKMLGDIMLMSRALFPHEKSHSLKAQAERLRIGEKGDEVINALGRRYADFTDVTLAAYASYCCNDVHLTYDLFSLYLNYDDGFPANELKVIDLTLKMFVEPKLRLDAALLTEHLSNIRETKAQALRNVASLVGSDDPGEIQATLASNPQFAALLERLGVEVPMKISSATGKEAPALAKTDEGFLALQEHPDVAVQALVAARLGVKSTLEETRTEHFLNIASRGLLPIPLRYYGAHTGRWAGCLVGDTKVIVYDPTCGVTEKRIVDVLADDLVWDGQEFVAHEGVVFSGYSEVIEWDNIIGTEDHVVFTDAGEISLREAMQGSHRITAAGTPSADAVDAARKYVEVHKKSPSL